MSYESLPKSGPSSPIVLHASSSEEEEGGYEEDEFEVGLGLGF